MQHEIYNIGCYVYDDLHHSSTGSSSFITNIDGRADQHYLCRSIFYLFLQNSDCSKNNCKIRIGIQYLPFGELFVNQSNNHDFDSRYKFTAKELDNETNYTYFGARYYDSDLSSWLSVDPLSDKYPSLSPYAYCANNPVVLVDPNGMEIDDYFTKDGKYLGSDNATTDYVRIISQNDWDANKKTSLCRSCKYSKTKTTINHKVGNSKSVSIVDVALSDQALINIVEHYDQRLDWNSKISDVTVKPANLGLSTIMRTVIGGGFYLFGLEIVSPNKDILFDNQGNGKIDPLLNSGSNITNALVHEYQHHKDKNQPMSEKTLENRAIEKQKNHSSYKSTTKDFQNVIDAYEKYWNNK